MRALNGMEELWAIPHGMEWEEVQPNGKSLSHNYNTVGARIPNIQIPNTFDIRTF